jgi:NhaA family Na+:H+ antiporter
MHRGWGIPMATDIAFSLSVLYILGKKVPFALKVFLTALAVVDDLGAVLVIAFFYSSDISVINLLMGIGFAAIMFIGNKAGIKSILFYVLLGVLGVWISFLLSGVHATIAAVLAAFMVPADVKIKKDVYMNRIRKHLGRFKAIDIDENMTSLTDAQLQLMDGIKKDTSAAIPPLQRLEFALHPFVSFIILPVFALANAGVAVNMNMQQLFSTNITLGVALGLLFGKVIGVYGATVLAIKLKVAPPPKGINGRNLLGIGLLAAIGFTMSLFVTSLAFDQPEYATQAKIGIFVASIVGGILGYIVLNKRSE